MPFVRFRAEAEELLRIEERTPSELKTGPGQGSALETIDHHESL
jgi:hypothetical protein